MNQIFFGKHVYRNNRIQIYLEDKLKGFQQSLTKLTALNVDTIPELGVCKSRGQTITDKSACRVMKKCPEGFSKQYWDHLEKQEDAFALPREITTTGNIGMLQAFKLPIQLDTANFFAKNLHTGIFQDP